MEENVLPQTERASKELEITESWNSLWNVEFLWNAHPMKWKTSVDRPPVGSSKHLNFVNMDGNIFLGFLSAYKAWDQISFVDSMLYCMCIPIAVENWIYCVKLYVFCFQPVYNWVSLLCSNWLWNKHLRSVWAWRVCEPDTDFPKQTKNKEYSAFHWEGKCRIYKLSKIAI